MAKRILPDGPAVLNPLLAWDVLLIGRGMSEVIRTWRDVAFLVAALAVAILWLRERVADLPAITRPNLAALPGALVAYRVARKLDKRLAHHVAEGVLSVQALTSHYRTGYRLAWLAAGAILLAAGAAVLDARTLLPLLAGYAAGALGSRLPLPRLRVLGVRAGLQGPSRRPRLEFGRWAARVAAAAAATIGLAWLFGSLFGDLSRTAALAILILASLVLLTRVDHPTVRFLALAGHGPWRSVGMLLAPAACYGAMLPLPAVLLLGSRDAVVAAILCAGMALVMALRILAYRVHEKSRADTILSIALSALALAAFAAPPLVLIAAPVLALILVRRSAQMTWRMQ